MQTYDTDEQHIKRTELLVTHDGLQRKNERKKMEIVVQQPVETPDVQNPFLNRSKHVPGNRMTLIAE